MAQKVFVTGGSGYLGSTLVPALLAKGYEVTVLDNLMHGQHVLLECCAYKGFNFVKGDICDHALINGLIAKHDIIIPLAAIVGAPACKLNPTLTDMVNRDAHLNIVNNTLIGTGSAIGAGWRKIGTGSISWSREPADGGWAFL